MTSVQQTHVRKCNILAIHQMVDKYTLETIYLINATAFPQNLSIGKPATRWMWKLVIECCLNIIDVLLEIQCAFMPACIWYPACRCRQQLHRRSSGGSMRLIVLCYWMWKTNNIYLQGGIRTNQACKFSKKETLRLELDSSCLDIMVMVTFNNHGCQKNAQDLRKRQAHTAHSGTRGSYSSKFHESARKAEHVEWLMSQKVWNIDSLRSLWTRCYFCWTQVRSLSFLGQLSVITGLARTWLMWPWRVWRFAKLLVKSRNLSDSHVVDAGTKQKSCC